jgi:hypothetical protein
MLVISFINKFVRPFSHPGRCSCIAFQRLGGIAPVGPSQERRLILLLVSSAALLKEQLD